MVFGDFDVCRRVDWSNGGNGVPPGVVGIGGGGRRGFFQNGGNGGGGVGVLVGVTGISGSGGSVPSTCGSEFVGDSIVGLTLSLFPVS